jgi:anti-sigma regulatory factor (Ser/Thr protein kinase)
VTLPADENAPYLGRSALNQAIPPPTLGERHADARLALSEIVANAVRHAGLRDFDVVGMVIEADEDHVRVEVEQRTSAADVRLVEPNLEGSDRVGGFGLRLVDQTADRWGYEAGPPGRVWFEFGR